jgi:fumarylacetoacetate (FAA) hydrolase
MNALKLATLKVGGRHGSLVVVSRDLKRACTALQVAPTLQKALENWRTCAPKLASLYAQLNSGLAPNSFTFDRKSAHSPLPRAYQWCEGSVWIVHLERRRRSTNRELPPQLYREIGMYQGGLGQLRGPDRSDDLRR